MERNIKLLSVFNFFLDFKFHSAVLIIYFSRVTGSYLLATSLFSVVMISSAAFEIPTGIYSDIIGRKKTVILGAVSATISAILYAAGHSYWPLFAGALLLGLSRAWYSGNNDALLWDSVRESGSKKTFAHYLGTTSSMFQLALMISAVVGSIIAQWSFPVIMWLSVVPQIICLIISFSLKNPKRFTKGKTNILSHIKISAFHLWNNKRLQLLSLMDILNFGIGEASFQFGAAFIGTIWPIWAIGFSRMISYGSAFISYWSSGKFIRKIGEYNILIFSNLTTRIINFIAYGFPTIISPILMASTAIWYGAREVSINTLIQKEYTQQQRATLSSISSLVGNIFYGAFAPIIGLVADAYGPAKALIMVQFCMLSVLYFSFKLKRMK
jgi:MFS family permease